MSAITRLQRPAPGKFAIYRNTAAGLFQDHAAFFGFATLPGRNDVCSFSLWPNAVNSMTPLILCGPTFESDAWDSNDALYRRQHPQRLNDWMNTDASPYSFADNSIILYADPVAVDRTLPQQAMTGIINSGAHHPLLFLQAFENAAIGDGPILHGSIATLDKISPSQLTSLSRRIVESRFNSPVTTHAIDIFSGPIPTTLPCSYDLPVPCSEPLF